MIPFYTNDAMKKNTIEVIKHARHLIDEYGWVQCKSGDRETGFCLTGACIEALEELRVDEVYPGYQSVERPAGRREGRGSTCGG